MASVAALRALQAPRRRRFRLLTIGQVTSAEGDACYAAALPDRRRAAPAGVPPHHRRFARVTRGSGMHRRRAIAVQHGRRRAGGLVVRDLSTAPFFFLAAATLAVAILAGLGPRAWREFGADPGTAHDTTQQAEPDVAAATVEGQST